MADIPPPPPPEPQPNSQTSIIAGLLNPYANVNIDEAKKLRDQYNTELQQTRGQLSQVQGRRQSITDRNLAAIDEAINGIQSSRASGAVAFDPAVSAAMAAGFLKTTPGTASNFAGELGSAMGNAAPVIDSRQKGIRDSFQILADLQRKRGEFESEPVKEELTELRARERDAMGNLKEAEKALTRAPAGSSPAATEKIELAKKKRLDDIIKRAQADADNTTKGMMNASTGKTLNITDRNKIQRYLTLEAIKDHNRAHKEGTPEWIDPAQFAMTDPEITEAMDLADKAQPSDEGKSRDYHEYERNLKPGEQKLSKPEWEAQNAAHKTVTVKRAEELMASENALDSTIATTANLKEIAEKLLRHPGLQGITGNWYGVEFNKGTNPQEVEALALLKQLQSIEFLKAIPNMKGFGTLTEKEGEKLGQSQNALARRMTTDAFRGELQGIVDRANKLEGRLRERLADKERKAGVTPSAPPSAEHIEMLRKDPTLADFFDKKYGAGAAARVLGR